MVKRGVSTASSRSIPRPPSHKEHHIKAILGVGLLMILVLIAASFFIFIAPGSNSGQAIGVAPNVPGFFFAAPGSVPAPAHNFPLLNGEVSVSTRVFANGRSDIIDPRICPNPPRGSGFCAVNIMPDGGNSDFCYTPTSTLGTGVVQFYCASSFQNNQNALVGCQNAFNNGLIIDSSICLQNRWISCPADGFFTATGAEDQLCHNSHWFTCGGAGGAAGGIKEGDAICHNRRWVPCINGQTNEDNTQLCVNERLSSCTPELINIRGSGEVVRNQLTPNNLICDGTHWIACDAEHRFLTSASDEFVCNNRNEWTDRVDFGPSGLTEVILTKNALHEINVSFNTTNSLSHLKLCDSNLGNVADQAELCYASEGMVIPAANQEAVRTTSRPGPLALESMARLANGNNLPHVFTFGQPAENYVQTPRGQYQVLALYEDQSQQPKKVSLITLRNMGPSTFFPLSSLSRNLAHGRRVAISFENQYYLVSQANEGLFDIAQLQLKHIPTGQPFTNPTNIGNNTYRFNILDSKYLFISLNGPNVIFQVGGTQEVPASFPIPHTLSQELEVPFNLRSPVILQDQAVAGQTLTICNIDNPRDPANTIICLNNQRILNVQKDVLTPSTINNLPVAFLYKQEQNQDGTSRKQVYLYKRVILSNQNSHLDYNNFINALVEGRKVVFEFDESRVRNGIKTLYLLAHPGRDLFDLRTVTLTSFTPQGQSTLTLAGSDAQITFPTSSGGQISIKRNYGLPPPPFDVKGLTQDQIDPIDIGHDIEVPFFSSSVLRFIDPAIGVVQKSPDDNPRSSTLFKLNLHDIRKDLAFKEPQIITDGMQNMLAYYHTAQVQGGVPTKIANMYLYYDLSDNIPDDHTFTEDFIGVITTGKRIAFKLDNKYYLLKHTNAPDQAAFFDLNNLRITNLDGENEVTPQVTNQLARFELEGARIEVEIDDENNLLLFHGVSGRAVLDHSAVGDFYGEIGPHDSLQIGGSTLRQCFTNAYQDLISAKVCDDNQQVHDTVIDTPVLVEIPVAAGVAQPNVPYLFETNGQTGDAKKVIVRKVITLDRTDNPTYQIADWVDFTHQVTAGAPLFRISGELFMPQTPTTTAQDFHLMRYQQQEPFTLRDIQPITPISANGTFVIKDTIVVFSQTETNNEDIPLSAQFTVQPYHFIPESGELLIYNSTRDSSTLSFSNILHQKPLRLIKNDAVFPDIIQFQLEDIFNRYFITGETKQIIIDGQTLELHIDAINQIQPNLGVFENEVIISIRRI